MATNTLNIGSYKRAVASGNIKPNSGGALIGVFCAASTSGTAQFYDDASTGTTIPITGSIPLVAGQWYPTPFAVVNGINLVITGTADVTVSFI